jgi:TonB family protein
VLRAWFTGAVLVAAVLTGGRLALAQSGEGPPEPTIELPKPKLVPDPVYPVGASGDAKVILRLIIDKDGTVRAAQVDVGAEPFSSAARDAARYWQFEPATRDGVPIVAKIRFEVSFVEQIVEPPKVLEPPPIVAPEPGEDGGEVDPMTLAPIDVVVEGLRQPPSVSSLRRAEVRQLPGAFGDPFRAIEILPGVTPIVSGLPFFYVRGAPPGNVGYFLDGVRVPYLFHAAAGPSVIHPAIVDRVDLYAGGYPAKYGRYAGAIVAAETTAPRTDWHGEGNIRLVDAGAFVEGGFAGGRGSALVAGRYSYTAGLFSLISPDITLDYRDYQARVSYDVNDRDTVSLFAFGSFDFLSQTTELPATEPGAAPQEVENVLFGSEFYRVDGRYDVRLPRGGKLRTAVTWGFDQTKVADGRNTQDVLVGSRMQLSMPFDDDFTLRSGLDFQLDNYTSDEPTYADPDDPGIRDFVALFPPRLDGAAAAWIDAVWRPFPRLELTPGVRVDTFTSAGARALSADPRLAVVVEVTDRVRILHALGMAHQTPAFIVPLPGLQVASLRGGLQRSLQAASGVEVDLPWSTTATVTAFDSVFLNMTDTLGIRPEGDATTQIPRSLGGAKGVEVFVRRMLSRRFGGFVSYTFSRTTRSVDDQSFPAAFDRSHVLNAAVAYGFPRGWRAGTRLALYSGPPLLVTPPGLPPGIKPTDPPRDPAFYRIDFRVEKKWQLTRSAWVAFVVEMLNATLNTETIQGNEVGPVTVPSIGVEGAF